MQIQLRSFRIFPSPGERRGSYGSLCLREKTTYLLCLVFYRAWNREIQIDAGLWAPSSQLLYPQHKQTRRNHLLFFLFAQDVAHTPKATALRRNQRSRASLSLAGFEVTLMAAFG